MSATNTYQRCGSRPLRIVLFTLGTLFTQLGIIGIILPILPTTPFLILAASCYARTSQRFYLLLTNNRLCGPLLRQWQQERTVSRRAKAFAITLLIATLGSSVLFFVPTPPLKIGLAVMGIGLVIFLLRLPTSNCSR